MYSGFSSHNEKAVVLSCCKKVSERVSSTSELKNVCGDQLRTYRTLEFGRKTEPFSYQAARSNCVSRTPSKRPLLQASSPEQGLKDSGKHEVNEKQRFRQFPSQESMTTIVRIFQLNKTLKRHLNQTLAERNTARKRRARVNHFLYFEYNSLLSCHSSRSDKSVGRWIELFEQAKGRPLIWRERNGTIRFGW